MIRHYDLNESPATHDFVNWLARAEKERIEAGAERLYVNIIPGSRNWSIRDKTLSKDRRWFAARDLLPQLSWLLPSVAGVSFLPEGKQTLDYRNLGYCPGNIFRASVHAKEEVAHYLKDKPKPVSISIRRSSFQPVRNGNVAEWGKVANWLTTRGYAPVVVPDIETALAGYPHGYQAAAFNADFRLALYEACTLNLMTNFGPLLLALMSESNVAAFRMVVPEVGASSEVAMRKAYLTPEADWGERKRLYWEPDTSENVIRRIEGLLA